MEMEEEEKISMPDKSEDDSGYSSTHLFVLFRALGIQPGTWFRTYLKVHMIYFF